MARRGRPRPQGGAPRGRRRPNRQRLAHQRMIADMAKPRVPETPLARIEEEVRLEVVRLVKDQQAGHGLLEEERLLARIVEQHPEHADAFDGAEEWTVTGDESSPFVHIALHKIVEQRVVTRDPRLDMSKLARDLPWHDAVHKGTELVAAELMGGELEEATR